MISRNQKAHYRSCERGEVWHWWLGAVVVLASLSAVAVFQSDWAWRDHLMIALPLVAAAASGLQTMTRFDLRADRHQTAAVDFGALRRQVEARTSGAYSDEENRAVLDEILAEYRRISKAAPLTRYSSRDGPPAPPTI